MTWFGGVSRFQFSYDDCPECNGVGFLIPAENNCLIASIVECSGFSSIQAERFLNTLTQIISTGLTEGKSVKIRGFGSFTRVSTESSPTQIRFTPGKDLLREVNRTE